MPFTDNQLANQMSGQLVASNVMTDEQLNTLLEDPTELNVSATLSDEQLGNFDNYWAALGDWMDAPAQGGNIAVTTGNNVPGRVGGNPQGMGPKSLYNDAFRDVNANINLPGFSQVKAVSAQLRFIKNMAD